MTHTQGDGAKKGCCEKCKGLCVRFPDLSKKALCDCHDTPHKDWEKEFDYMERNHGYIPEHKKRIKDFISKLLTEQRKRVVEEAIHVVKKMKWEKLSDYGPTLLINKADTLKALQALQKGV